MFPPNDDLTQEFGTEAVHRRFAVLFVHQADELFQLLQPVIPEVPFLTDLPERLMKPGVLLPKISVLVLTTVFLYPCKGCGTMEIQHHSRISLLLVTVDCRQFKHLDMKHKGPLMFET